jgi:hypothetical protein
MVLSTPPEGKVPSAKDKPLLAPQEDAAIARVPKVVGVPAVAAESEPVAAAHDVEHAQVATAAGDGLHADNEPLTDRLVLVLQP